MKTYNEFRKDFAEKMAKQGKTTDPKELSKAWESYKNGGKKASSPKAPKKEIPAEVKALNKKLTAKNIELQELRAQKKKGKDVKAEIKKALAYLKENRQKKKDIMAKVK